MKKVFLIHGWQGTPYHGWRPWLKNELEKRGFKVILPAMPNPDYLAESEWTAHINHLVKMLGSPDGDFIFVGHSLGATAALRYLETLQEGEAIGGAVLVAGVAEYNGIEEFRNFFGDRSNGRK